MTTIFVANRGEIALRVIRAVRELGFESAIAVSEPDRDSLWAAAADDVIVLPGKMARDTYLHVDSILDAAERLHADAVHPGYGFLSENTDFARSVQQRGMTWIGPDPDTIDLMGDKAHAIAQARSAGVPTVPGSGGIVATADEAAEIAAEIGYPVAIKASAGGGGKGIRIVGNAEELHAQWSVTAHEAAAAFGDGSLYLERFVSKARHVEVQVFGDGEQFIHLYERDCSLQRRHQKLVEETPAPNLSAQVRDRLCASAAALAASVGYRGAGTVEFLYEPSTESFFFIEMNTRIQVEHPITEELLGVDLVREQISVALGAPLSIRQDALAPRGHVIEVRINAENPDQGFFPSPGHIDSLQWPAGPGVRVDAGFTTGDDVTPFYDSLLGKVIVRDTDRTQALARADRALGELEAHGVHTTAPFARRLIQSEKFVEAAHYTDFIEEELL
ncbi:acetyl/propionyl/methylcrotonyl-CoA carboxylase subunit alpha [Pseudoclavibacter sp. CFCC 11306]|uniref:acetyl-CoA carboxylase biotin carboxylase subunit n=1 Tax=Pseudoclavibacter sp. CFCC 11306 TaxID=1564493 RepID=UPI001301559C|nr:biotin carboxylase N-terminal domain-containing protein [Pseudoclavibacter sp. CFCC 11306]KAB1658861.1 ATP-grasp domain-containing protein [Pseudoclavibacter sp. CFCC 11306]